MNSFLKKMKMYGLRTSAAYIYREIVRGVWMRHVRHSYSQSGEDLVIDSLLHNKKNGFYVDIGAYDPLVFSNTKRFYQKGWRGINVEPDTHNFQKFLKHRRRDINVNVGIDSKRGGMKFFHFFPETLSTFSETAAKIYKKEGFKIIEEKVIPVIALSDLLNKYAKNKKIDFLSVDTEGTDLKVLKSNDWRKFRPKVICIESTLPSGKLLKHDPRVQKYLNSVGYIKHRDVVNNSIYIDTDSIWTVAHPRPGRNQRKYLLHLH